MYLHTKNFWSFGALSLENQKNFLEIFWTHFCSSVIVWPELCLLAVFCDKEGWQIESLIFSPTAKDASTGEGRKEQYLDTNRLFLGFSDVGKGACCQAWGEGGTEFDRQDLHGVRRALNSQRSLWPPQALYYGVCA